MATCLLHSQYKMFLNSDDLYDLDLPLLQTRAHGGTLTLWKDELDSFITVLPTFSSRITPIVLDCPGYQTTVHINIYLPTAGRDSDFIEALATLQATIDDANEKYPTALVYLKGDANAACPPRFNNKRDAIFQQFCEDNSFINLSLDGHKTYHHFTGFGISDSNIDVALSTSTSSDGIPSPSSESLLCILCSKEDHRTSNSHHDAIITGIHLNFMESLPKITESNDAPTIENTRHKIIWSEENLENYSDLITPVLIDLQETWLDSNSPSSMSILLQQTNNILTAAAKATQGVIYLNKEHLIKKVPIPPDLVLASKLHKQSHDNLKKVLSDSSSTAIIIDSAKTLFSQTRASLQKTKRNSDVSQESERAQNLGSILSSNPSALFQKIKSNKRKSVSINKLNVGDELFTDKDVGNGFFKSISALKTRNEEELLSCQTFQDFLSDHEHILEICKEGKEIPPLTLSQALDLLKSIKPGVTDIYSISALHYLNGGDLAVTHFQLLLNAVLKDVENYALSEINTVHAIILHKGHGKDKFSDRSYRTISSCPFIAKCADKYIGQLEESNWSSVQAETQFQGKGLSHEHCALLLTESINFTVFVSKLAIFCLYLDAKSAYDRALREILTRRMYLDGTCGKSLLFLDARLKNRVTYVEWDKEIMGPIKDQQGVEQGGPNSSEEYKIYNNEQLSTAQDSKFGINCGPLIVSSDGCADDSVLMSSDFHQLGHLLNLTNQYCHKYKVEMTPEKTKLQVFAPAGLTSFVDYFKSVNYLSINGVPLSFTDTTEHVGVVRSPVSGNIPHILKRITSHKKAVAAVLSAGLSRRHRGNPAASLKVEKLYGLPVLMSGIGSLFLLQSELDILSQHYKLTLEGLQRLYQKTPESFVFFLGGSLPFPALLHIRQLTLFAMICRIPDNILHKMAEYILTSLPDSTKSWFMQIKNLCFQYNLPHPLLLLTDPPEKQHFKKTVKLNVLDFWQAKLRTDVSLLPSLKYFKPEYMSLDKPHPLWSTCGSNSYELNKACIQAKYLSGRFRTEKLLSHFSKGNSMFCQLHPGTETIGDLLHHLVLCPSLASRRSLLYEYWDQISLTHPVCNDILHRMKTTEPEKQLQFLLDCSVIPEIISAAQLHGDSIYAILFKATRTFTYSIYRSRLKLLDQWI